MTLFIDLLAAYGVAFGLQNDKAPFLPQLIRKDGNFFDSMFRCAYCTGFHAGWMVWVIRVLCEGLPAEGWHNAFSALGFAMASAAWCYSVDVVLQWFESHMPAAS